MKKFTTIFLTAILVLTATVLAATAQDDILSRTEQNKRANTPQQETDETNLGDPGNDMLASATVLTLNGNSLLVSGTNFSASKETGEPNHAENAGGKSVWFTITPTATIMARIKTEQNGFDTLLAVYQGTNVNNLTTVGFNDDCSSQCSTASVVDLMLVGGQTYKIAVDGYNSGTTAGSGSFQLRITTFNAPPQDNLANAYDLGITTGSIAGTNHLATRQAGEPNHFNANITGVKSVWYKWTPQTTFSASVELPENFYSLLNVYESDVANPTLAELNYVRNNIDNNGFTNEHYRIKFLATANRTYYIAISAVDFSPESGNFQLKYSLNRLRYSTSSTILNDKTSIRTFRPSNGTWYGLQSVSNQAPEYKQFGQNGDVPIPADYDGSGFFDYAVTRGVVNAKFWYINNIGGIQWGLATDKEVTGDFDRDGRADLAVIRQTPNGLAWYIRQSSNGALRSFLWGASGDKPVLGDFDGDGATDVAVTRFQADGLYWFILKSGFNQPAASYTQATYRQFGVGTDRVTAEDYDGDGKTDIAVFRPTAGNWYILRSSDDQLQFVQFGTAGDKPQPADYDGDGKAEPALFRPSTAIWFTSQNPANNYGAVVWGASNDILASSMTMLSQ